MSRFFPRVFGLSPKEQSRQAKTLGKLKTVSEFLVDAHEAFKDVELAKTLTSMLPWAEVGGALAESFAPIRFLVTLFDKLTKIDDPNTLGYLACTTAYQRSVVQTFQAVGDPGSGRKAKKYVDQLKESPTNDEIADFGRFSYRDALQHPFVKSADGVLVDFARSCGYTQSQTNHIVGKVHDTFVVNLKQILSGKMQEKFEPFIRLMELDTEEARVNDALLTHAEYQRRQFEEERVSGTEPFALQHVYIETECGRLKWGEISDPDTKRSDDPASGKERINPFLEQHGGRHDLVETVWQYIGNSKFRDAIVVQGAAGSGKSAFTLRLCSHLLSQGLRPIRVRLRDVRPEQSFPTCLESAVQFNDPEAQGTDSAYHPPKNLFRDGSLFDDPIRPNWDKNFQISRYVLILDGWDEINLAVDQGFQQQVNNLLASVRYEYLSTNQSIPVRVIVTGRPSPDVEKGTFLRSDTPILTLRNVHPDKLEGYVDQIRSAKDECPLGEGSSTWTVPDKERFAKLFEEYRGEFEKSSADDAEQKTDRARETAAYDRYDVLGLPLLTYLAIRLMSEWKSDPADLFTTPTTLYRNLIDMTCPTMARTPDDKLDPTGRARIEGSDLRRLLRETAAAMTVLGVESLSFKELKLRLRQQARELFDRVDESAEGSALSSLVVSFFFKGGHSSLGVEFLHKSFREFLFAEEVVETLKKFGRDLETLPPERPVYWRDFAENDVRHKMSRELAGLLAPQWISPEVSRHLEELVRWEIERAEAPSEDDTLGRVPTASLNIDGWEKVRDLLADLWDWWGEAVPLRLQPRRSDRGGVVFDDSYACLLAEWAAPLSVDEDGPVPSPTRAVTLDAHLGDALFRLCCHVHFQVAVHQGWLSPRGGSEQRPSPHELWNAVADVSDAPRQEQIEENVGKRRLYQSSVEDGDDRWILFSPSGPNRQYFENYVCRINAAGWRPYGLFPAACNLSGLDLREVALRFAFDNRNYQDRTRQCVSYSNLSDADATGAILIRWVAECALATGMKLNAAYFELAEFSESDFSRASLRRAAVYSGLFQHTTFRGATLDESRFVYCKFQQVDLDVEAGREHVFGLQEMFRFVEADAATIATLPDEIRSDFPSQSRVELP